MSPEELIEKMCEALMLDKHASYNRKDIEKILRIVLKAIQDGEAVEIKGSGRLDDGDYEEHIELKPSYDKFLKG